MFVKDDEDDSDVFPSNNISTTYVAKIYKWK